MLNKYKLLSFIYGLDQWKDIFVENYVPYVSYLGARTYYVFEGLASFFFF